MIFFHDKHWYRSEPLFSVEGCEDEEEEENAGNNEEPPSSADASRRTPSPTTAHKPLSHLCPINDEET